MFEKLQFVKSVYKLADLPKLKLPEIVLCGRSNVGKSSFINSLFNRKDLAKISSTPGKTRTINYYNIDDRFYIVDLPGFGYAKTSKTEREYWAELLGSYLKKSGHITLAFHLIDSRHKPTELDVQLNGFLHTIKIPFIIILTKADKLNQSQFMVAKKSVKECFPEVSEADNLLFYSSVSKRGRKEIVTHLAYLFYK